MPAYKRRRNYEVRRVSTFSLLLEEITNSGKENLQVVKYHPKDNLQVSREKQNGDQAVTT